MGFERVRYGGDQRNVSSSSRERGRTGWHGMFFALGAVPVSTAFSVFCRFCWIARLLRRCWRLKLTNSIVANGKITFEYDGEQLSVQLSRKLSRIRHFYCSNSTTRYTAINYDDTPATNSILVPASMSDSRHKPAEANDEVHTRRPIISY